MTAPPAVVRRVLVITEHWGSEEDEAAAVTRLLSRYSLGIYFLHPIVIHAIASPLSAILNVPLPLSLVGFVVITVSGLAVAAVLSVLLSATALAPTIGASRRSLPWRGGSRAAPHPSSG